MTDETAETAETGERMSSGGVRTGTAMTDRMIPDPESGGPPTARNYGWYEMYLPEQRYVAYLTMYKAYAEAAASGRMDEMADFGPWILGHAAVDKEAATAGLAMIAGGEPGEVQDGMYRWHNATYGTGTYYQGTDHPFADLELPQINPSDPQGTIQAFITSSMRRDSEYVRPKSMYTNNMTEEAMLWGVGLMEKGSDILGDILSVIPGIESGNIDPAEKYERSDDDNVSMAELWRSVGEELYGPEEGDAAWRRNMYDFGAQMFTNVAVGAVAPRMGPIMPAAGMSQSVVTTPAAASVGLTKANMAYGMNRAWNSQMMGTVGRTVVSPIANAMRTVLPEGIRMTAARTMNQIAGMSKYAKSDAAPAALRIPARSRPRTKLGAAAAGTLAYNTYEAATMPIGDIDIGDYMAGLPDGLQKDYIMQVVETRQEEVVAEGGTVNRPINYGNRGVHGNG